LTKRGDTFSFRRKKKQGKSKLGASLRSSKAYLNQRKTALKAEIPVKKEGMESPISGYPKKLLTFFFIPWEGGTICPTGTDQKPSG